MWWVVSREELLEEWCWSRDPRRRWRNQHVKIYMKACDGGKKCKSLWSAKDSAKWRNCEKPGMLVARSGKAEGSREGESLLVQEQGVPGGLSERKWPARKVALLPWASGTASPALGREHAAYFTAAWIPSCQRNIRLRISLDVKILVRLYQRQEWIIQSKHNFISFTFY